MTLNRFHAMSNDTLVKRFVDIALGEEDAQLDSDMQKTTRLAYEMRDILEELKRRPGDGRHDLLRLYDHPNLRVLLMAAKATRAVAPQAARAALQAVAASSVYPEAGEAATSLRFWDEGVYKPT